MQSSTLKGIFWIVICMFAAACADGTMKNLRDEFHPFQLSFFRGFVVFLVLLVPWFLYRRKTAEREFEKVGAKNYILLGGLKLVSSFSYIIALNYLPLPVIGAIILVTTPLSMFLAVLILKETLKLHQIVGVVGGLLGVLVVIKPGFVEVTPYIMIPFITVVVDAFYKVVVKSLSVKVRIFDVAFYPLIFMSIISLPFAMMHWEMPSLDQAILVIGFASCISIYLLAMVKAYSYADLSALAPFDFLYLLFLSIIAYLFYDELIDIWTALGGLIIVMSGWYIICKEKGKHVPQEADIGH